MSIPYLTFRMLKEALAGMTEEQLDNTVAVYDFDNDEVFSGNFLGIVDDFDGGYPDSGVLDPGHPYLVFNMCEWSQDQSQRDVLLSSMGSGKTTVARSFLVSMKRILH